MRRRAPHLLLGAGIPLAFAGLAAPSASAQNQGLVVRDGTLGSAPAGVVAPGPDDLGTADYLIRADLGEQRGSNLFHSFERFSIGSGERATFTADGAPDPGSIDNVISRVTGGAVSEIDGMLHSTIDGAALWLLNPSGVMFGAGASLDVPGSFHASTSDYLDFGAEGLERFYGDPTRPSVLSTAAPRSFGFLSASGAALLRVDRSFLDVDPGETLELSGGDLLVTDARLRARGGRVDLAAHGDLTLSSSRVNVGFADADAGSISIRGGRIEIRDDSRVLAETAGQFGAGTIEIAARESALVDASLVSVSTRGSGDAGSIRIESPDVTLRNGPGFREPDHDNVPHAMEVGVTAETGGSGDGGRIDIDAERLSVENGASVSAISYGVSAAGDAGTIAIRASDRLELSTPEIPGGSAPFSMINAGTWGSLGDGGRIEIDAGTLRIDGANDARSIVGVWAGAAAFFGTDTPVVPSVPGAPGTLIIAADRVEVVGGGIIGVDCYSCSSKFGDEGRRADAGLLRITARDVEVSGFVGYGSRLGAEAGAVGGDAGRIQIESGSLTLDDGAVIDVSSGGSSSAGTVQIEADSLKVGARAAIDLSGSGPSGGALRIDADSVELAGALRANTSGPGAGPGGSIELDVAELEILAEGIVATNSLGGGDAGSIRIGADSIHVDHARGTPFSLSRILDLGSKNLPTGVTGILSATVGGGKGGSIALTAKSISIENGAFVTTATVGGAGAGSVDLDADRIRLVNGGFVGSSSLPDLSGRPGSSAGDVRLAARESIELAGRRQVELHDVALEEWSRVDVAALGSGTPGTLSLEAPRIAIDAGAVSAVSVSAPGSADAGISLVADELQVRNGGRVDASSFAAGPGGSIDLRAARSIAIEGDGSGIASRTGGSGPGGDVVLHAPVIRLADGAEASATSESGLGPTGAIFASLIADHLLSVPEQPATGDAGSVRLEAAKLVHLDRAEVTTSAPHSAASGGNITIDPVLMVLENGSRIAATSGAGSGGHIVIAANHYFASADSVVSAASGIPELSGTIELRSPEASLTDDLTPLPANVLDASSLMAASCGARTSGAPSGTFAVRGPGGIPAEPDGWLRAPVRLAGVVSAAPAPRVVVAGATGPLLAGSSCE
jgi:filamentous hemagglutinin family protein